MRSLGALIKSRLKRKCLHAAERINSMYVVNFVFCEKTEIS